MRDIDATIKARALSKHQTVHENNEHSMEIIVSRPRTAIVHQRYWQESIVTAGATSVCTSVAIKRTGRWGEKVYVAYVDSTGLLTVKSAPLRYPIREMSWTTVATIAGCAACTLEFEGHFRHVGRNVEFRTDEIPYLCYVTTAGALFVGLLGGPYEQLASANVIAVDAINGVSNTFDAQDQGFFVFYIVSGTVYYNTFADGAWEGQREVSIAPANAVAIKAERTFDYRIVLQITDNVGALYEIFTKMESTGWNGTDFISASLSVATALIAITYLNAKSAEERITASLAASSSLLYAFSPVMVSASNVIHTDAELEIEDDYGYKVVLTWDERVFDVAGHEASFSLVDEDEAVFGCTSVEKTGDREITLLFQNFNNAIGDLTLSYAPGTMMGDVVAVEADSIIFTPTGLVPFATEPPVPISAENVQNWEEPE